MKDSGIEWIGKIPAGWKIEKAKYTFAQRSERGNNISLQLLSPTQNFGVIPQVKYDALTGMKSVKLHEGIELHELKTIHKGDFCISLRSFQGGFEYSIYEGVVSPAYRVFYATKQIVEKYYKYLFGEMMRINDYLDRRTGNELIDYFGKRMNLKSLSTLFKLYWNLTK